MSTQCRWLHHWGKWSMITGKRGDGSPLTGQKRVCERCGRVQMEEIRA